MKNKNTMILVAIILVIVAAVGGFFGGMTYQKSQTPSFGMMGQNGFRQNGDFAGRFGQNGQNMRPVSGEIVSVDNSSMTVKLNDGSTKIVILSSSTSINKAATGSASDLKTGEKVAAFGTANSDGSITASSIQLNPTIRNGMGGTQRQ